MFRRLFRSKKVSDARPTSWLDCDERECPVQRLVCEEGGCTDVPNELSHVVGRGHRCSAARVDDYEGVSWLGRLEWPEWPVQEQSFENREEDLSVASCVESLWSRRCFGRGSGGARSLPAEAGLAGRPGLLQDRRSPRKDDCVRDAVMAKLGLQVTCLGSMSPMSKSYPGQKAVFSAYRGLSLYKSGGDATMAAAAAASARRSPTSRGELYDENDVEAKPGAGDHGHSPDKDSKSRDRNGGAMDERNDRRLFHQSMYEPHPADVGGTSFETFHAKSSRVVSARSNCSHLEGLLEEHEAKAAKERMLNESGDDGAVPGGLANTSGSLDTSTLSGDIKLDHIEDIGSRLHSTPSRPHGGCGVEDDRRLQLGLGDFDHLGGTATCSRARGDTSLHVKVTGSGDCEQGSGGSSQLPATSSPIPTEVDEDGACLSSFGEDGVIENKANVVNHELCNEEFVESKTLKDESFSSDMTVRRLSYGDPIDDLESEFASQQSSESAGDFLDAGFDTDCSEVAAVEADFFSHMNLNPNFVSTSVKIRDQRAACEQQSSEWRDFDVFREQQRDEFFGVFDASPFPKGAECKSVSMSCEVDQSLNSGSPSSRIATLNSGRTSASRPSELTAVFDNNEQRQLSPSPTNSIDGQISVSSYGSFLTVDSYDEEADFPNAKLIGFSTNSESAHDLSSPIAPCPATVHNPLRPESQSFQGYEEAVGSSPVGCATSDELPPDMNLVEHTSSPLAYGQLRPESQSFQSYEDAASYSSQIELDTEDASDIVGPGERLPSADYEPVVQETGGSSSTTTLSFHVLDEDADERTSYRSSSSNNSSSSSNGTSSSNSSRRSSSGSCSGESPAESGDENISAAKSSPTPPQSTSPVQPKTENDAINNSGASSPFPLQDYRSCRDFLRKLTNANPELSYSLSKSFASEECGVSEAASIEDVCSQIFSSYNESFTHFEALEGFPVLSRSSAAEMLTCPELRPLRLEGNAKDVFEPVLSRDQKKRLKRSTVPAAAASDTAATTSKISEKRSHMPSASSVSMPDLNHSQKGTWPPGLQEQSGVATTSDANLDSVRAHASTARKVVGFAV
ncbi:serine-rich adhesin for platelets-like isoform X2 [Dermacentor albipictus]|uniref:serine-rich adhesin for platelets-like isoform X2 n=1 Tax=Dermacentor albipictus TaxID=60249 RepID=UPI0031FCF5F4